MHLHRLPNELIQNIAFLIVAHDPLGPPKALIPLLLSSKRLHDALLSPSPALKARIFRLKFDTSAVSRRSFSPYDLHLADQLEFYCGILQIIKNKDVYHEDVVDLLLAIYMMMLDNDGKNFAQLQSAGIAEFIDKFIRLRLWEGRMESPNAGWPVASVANRCALWIAWLTMDRRTIFKESTQARDELITLIFPFAILSPRYPSTEAPPNHFHLPLLPESPAYQRPIVSSSKPHQPPYPHYSPHPTMHQYYFGSIQSISPPLISVAAKLLFTARKEIFPITIPPVLPPGLRSEDYAEFNKVKAAEVVRGARWDWDRGCAVAVNNRRLRNAFTPMTNDEFVQFEELINNEVEVIADDDEESRRWDEEWWRRILCGDLKALRPKFPPGLVYKPGTLRGTWQGRLYVRFLIAIKFPFFKIDICFRCLSQKLCTLRSKLIHFILVILPIKKRQKKTVSQRSRRRRQALSCFPYSSIPRSTRKYVTAPRTIYAIRKTTFNTSTKKDVGRSPFRLPLFIRQGTCAGEECVLIWLSSRLKTLKTMV